MAGRSRGSIVSRGKWSWGVVIPLGKDPETGKYKQKWYTVHGTKKDAEKFLAEKLVELDRHTLVEDTKMKIKDYMQKWLDDYARVNVAPKTLVDYERIIRQHIIPYLGEIPLADLKPLDIQGFYTYLGTEGRKDGKPGGLSPRSIQYCHSVLREALGHAVRWELIYRNPAEAVEPPRNIRKPINPMPPDHVTRFLTHAENHRLYPVFITAIGTGMRQGEILGLRWEDVNLEDGTCSVVQVLTVIKGKLFFKERPKNKSSMRKAVFPPGVVEELKKIKVQQAKEKMAIGSEYQDNHLVFCQPSGKPWWPRNVDRELDKLLKKADLPHYNFHALRHTSASLLLVENVHPKMVSAQLGHLSYVSMDTYSHILPSMQKEAVAKLDKYIRRK